MSSEQTTREVIRLVTREDHTWLDPWATIRESETWCKYEHRITNNRYVVDSEAIYDPPVMRSIPQALTGGRVVVVSLGAPYERVVLTPHYHRTWGFSAGAWDALMERGLPNKWRAISDILFDAGAHHVRLMSPHNARDDQMPCAMFQDWINPPPDSYFWGGGWPRDRDKIAHYLMAWCDVDGE